MCFLIILYFCIFLPFCIGNLTTSECYSRFMTNCCKGYHLIDGECIPICEGGCNETEVCLRPNICGLLDSVLILMDRRQCASQLSDGENYCDKCYPTHLLINDICQPYCHQICTNGFCDSTGEVCKCNPGYQTNLITNTCEPINSIKRQPNCVNESSCQNLTSSTSTTNVIPNCQNDGCIDGICIDGVCQNLGSSHTSIPTPDFKVNCRNDCSGGICINGICQNQEVTSIVPNSPSDGEFLISTTDISSNCQNGCHDGICIEGICQNHDENSTISPSSIDVTSNCQNGCWGGMCHNGICQCKDELILNEETNDCIMPCEKTCKNGVCNQDRTCECSQGYILQNHSGCVPQCDRECVNSVCVAPTHCECIEGDISRFNFSSALECLSTCEDVDGKNGCLNGTCVAVNKCECYDGFFQKPDDRFECVATSSLVDISELQRKFSLSMGISIVILTLLIIISFVCFARKRMRLVYYNVNETEKYNSTTVFQNYGQRECVL